MERLEHLLKDLQWWNPRPRSVYQDLPPVRGPIMSFHFRNEVVQPSGLHGLWEPRKSELGVCRVSNHVQGHLHADVCSGVFVQQYPDRGMRYNGTVALFRRL